MTVAGAAIVATHAPYAVEREIEDIAALIEEAGGSAFVYGKSSGAALALEAANHGLPITKLALYEPPFIVDDARSHDTDGLCGASGLSWSRSGRRGDAVEYFMANAVEVPAEMLAQMRQSPMWPAMEAMAHTLAYDGADHGRQHGGQAASTGTVGRRHDADARHGWRRQPDMDA